MKPTRQRPYRKESKKKNHDPTPEYFKMIPSQHPDDKELVQRRELLEAIQTIQSFINNKYSVLSRKLDELYTKIEENS